MAKRFRLLDLPPEVRNMVYRWLIKTTNLSLDVTSYDTSAKKRNPTGVVALLLVDRQIHNELEPYAINNFRDAAIVIPEGIDGAWLSGTYRASGPMYNVLSNLSGHNNVGASEPLKSNPNTVRKYVAASVQHARLSDLYPFPAPDVTQFFRPLNDYLPLLRSLDLDLSLLVMYPAGNGSFNVWGEWRDRPRPVSSSMLGSLKHYGRRFTSLEECANLIQSTWLQNSIPTHRFRHRLKSVSVTSISPIEILDEFKSLGLCRAKFNVFLELYTQAEVQQASMTETAKRVAKEQQDASRVGAWQLAGESSRSLYQPGGRKSRMSAAA